MENYPVTSTAKISVKDRLADVMDSMLKRKKFRVLENKTEQILLTELEQLVDGTDSRIRLVSGYKRKLLAALKTSLDYADQLVDEMPPAIEVNSKNFISDPYVNAFFATIWDLQIICKRSSELKEFFEEAENSTANECCVFLCMEKIEKNVLGMELSGDQVRKDVKQTSVSFSDHRIHAPAAREPGAREKLKQCIFEGLVTNALSCIVELRAKRRQLESEQRMLISRLRQPSISPGDAPRTPVVRAAVGMQEGKQRLAEIESKLKALGYITPKVSLDQVKSVLSHPEEFIRLEKISMKVDRMGIKISDDVNKPGNNLNLTEVKISGQKPRIVTLAKLKRNELIAREASPALYA